MNKTLMVGSIILWASSGSLALAHEITRGEAAELGLHRVERLVTLKKVHPSFQTQSDSVVVTLLNPSDPATQPTYKSAISQGPAADGSRRSIDLLQDTDGKTMSFTEGQGTDAAQLPVWPAKDALTLLEYSLHCVEGEAIENDLTCANNTAILAPFNQGLESATLTQAKNADGSPAGAVVDIKAEGQTKTLRIRFMLDGMLDPTKPIEFI